MFTIELKILCTSSNKVSLRGGGARSTHFPSQILVPSWIFSSSFNENPPEVILYRVKNPQVPYIALVHIESKIQNIPAPVAMHIYTQVLTLLLPYSDKTVFCPPSSNFLNEGLTYTVRRYQSIFTIFSKKESFAFIKVCDTHTICYWYT